MSAKRSPAMRILGTFAAGSALQVVPGRGETVPRRPGKAPSPDSARWGWGHTGAGAFMDRDTLLLRLWLIWTALLAVAAVYVLFMI